MSQKIKQGEYYLDKENNRIVQSHFDGNFSCCDATEFLKYEDLEVEEQLGIKKGTFQGSIIDYLGDTYYETCTYCVNCNNLICIEII